MGDDGITLTSLPESGLPERIGPYKIVQRLGEGGMGEVYEAFQQEPVRRRVAIKLIKAGMDTRQVVARFEGERQALALMDHPNIAHVFDAGATEQGRPYFAMELVRGIPITAFCDEHRLDTDARLKLFNQICEGVQHAHQKGIIHRDLKPTNVLVTVQDDRPVPKIIDFGVAKATGERLTDKTVFTAMGQVIGTLDYMSPEQAELTGLDIDTRTDVYSLGVLLYELLVGVRPFDSAALRREGLDEVRRKIREDEPPKPSTRLTSLGDASTPTARARRTDLPALSRRLRGDLDWIVMKAIEKDRTRRYGSATALSADIERFLNHEPVLASPPSATYRARKFVRRHRTGVVASLLVLGVLLIGIAGTTVGMLRAVRAERRAVQEAETARQVSEFMEELFRLSDPNELRANTVTAREILDEGTRRIERELSGQPAVQARLLGEVGRVYMNLGLYDEAAPLLQKSLSLRERELGDDDPEVAHSLNDLSVLALNRGDYPEARRLIERAVAIAENALGPDHPDLAEALHQLGWTLWAAGDFEQAKEPLERSLRIRESALGPGHPSVADGLNTLGAWYYRIDDYDRAREYWERSLAIREAAAGPEHPMVAMTLNNLSVILTETGDHAAARPLLERTIAIQEKTLGPGHPDLASGLNNLAELLVEVGELEEARPLYERAIAIQEAATGADHPEVARYLANLGKLELWSGNVALARDLYDRALAIRERSIGPDHTDTAWSRYGLGMALVNLGEYAEAEDHFNLSIGIFDAALGPDSPSSGWPRYGLSRVHAARGRFGEAEQEFERSIALLKKGQYETRAVSRLLDNYALVLRESGRDSEAADLEARAEAIRSKAGAGASRP